MIAPIIALIGIVTFITGAWLVNSENLWGVLVLILGLFLFVMGFASSFPQSTEHARDEVEDDDGRLILKKE